MKTYGRNAAGFSMREIVFTGLMTALVFVATYVPHIPIPLGYAHLGDAVIFLLAVLAPRRSVLFAACLGSAMADIFGGFALWAGPTILIKLIMAEIVCRLGWRQAIPSREPSSTTAWRRHLPPHRGSLPRASRTASLHSFWCLPFGSIFRSGDSEIFVKPSADHAVLRRRQRLA